MRVPSKTLMGRAAAQIDAARDIRLAHGLGPTSRSMRQLDRARASLADHPARRYRP